MDIVKRQQLGVVSLLIFAVVLVVGITVYASINTSTANIATTTVADMAIGNVSSNTNSAFQLISVGPIIYGAVIILGIVGLLYLRR